MLQILMVNSIYGCSDSYLSIDGEPYAPHQLTTLDNVVRAAFPSPVDDGITFFADYQGNENFQIYHIADPFNGWPEAITNNLKVKNEWSAECVSNNGRSIMYSSNKEKHDDMLVYVHDKIQNETLCLTNTPGWYIPGYWSPDNKRINFSQFITDIHSQAWFVDLQEKN